jgi:hypothetical protein
VLCSIIIAICISKSALGALFLHQRLQMNERVTENSAVRSLYLPATGTMRVIVLLVFAFENALAALRESDCSIHNGVNTNYFRA